MIVANPSINVKFSVKYMTTANDLTYPTFCISTKGKIDNKHMQVLLLSLQILNMQV